MRKDRLTVCGAFIGLVILVALSLLRGASTATQAQSPQVPSRQQTEAVISGSEDVLGIPEGVRMYTLDCRDYSGEAKVPLIGKGSVSITVKTGIPFLYMAGRDTLSARVKQTARHSPIGRGFRGIIGETEKGEAVLDITFEDLEEVGAGTEKDRQFQGRVVRWVKTDFVGKLLEFVMPDQAGAPRWGISLTIAEAGRARAEGGKETGTTRQGSQNKSLEEKVDNILEALGRNERTLQVLQERLLAPPRSVPPR